MISLKWQSASFRPPYLMLPEPRARLDAGRKHIIIFSQRLSLKLQNSSPLCYQLMMIMRGVSVQRSTSQLEVSMGLCEISQCLEVVPTKAFSLLKVPTTAFTIKNFKNQEWCSNMVSRSEIETLVCKDHDFCKCWFESDQSNTTCIVDRLSKVAPACCRSTGAWFKQT